MSSEPHDPAPQRPPSTPPDRHSVRRPRHLVFGTRELRLADNAVTCRVQLLRDREPFWGEARDLDTELGRARAAARATLDATSAAAPDVGLGLHGITLLDLFGGRYVILAVEAASDRRFGHLAGIAAVDASVDDAACLATLDAVERWVSA